MTQTPTPVHPVHAPATGKRPHPACAALADHRYVLMRTFRRDGRGVDTPLWFAFVDDDLIARTDTAAAKVRRIVANHHVELRPCDWRGRAVEGRAWTGRAELLNRDEGIAVEHYLHKRYGWQWNILPMIPVPGVTNGHGELNLRQRLAHARARQLWNASSIIRVTLDTSGARTRTN